MDTGTAMTRAREVLRRYFGYDSFRHGQEEAVGAILSGRDALCVMPTGAGKSICYEVPALLTDGITLVISPLVSLMQDQVRALTALSIPAAFCNSTLSAAEYRAVTDGMASGAYKLVYVAPERLDSTDFCSLCTRLPISLIAVDEAHCVSQWGQDFRPSYRRIAGFVASLARRPVLAAFTATAAENVRVDIIALLGLRDPFVCVTGFDRPNLYFGVIRAQNRNAELLTLLEKYNGKSGIVYCMTRKTVEEVCDFLRGNGYAATRYHAGLSEGERKQNQDDFLYDRCTIMVATNAFGMGIDKSNVSFVIHYNMPKDLESYYQEAGRAGRDGANAECVLLFSPGDIYLLRSLILRPNPDPTVSPEVQKALVDRNLHRLNDMYDYGNSTDCLRGRILRYFGENGMTDCGNCSHCLTPSVPIDATVDAQKFLSCVIRTQCRYGALTVIGVLVGSESKKILAAGLNEVRTYGIMQECDKMYLEWLADQLVACGYMARNGEYSVLSVTDEGWRILRGEIQLSLRLPEYISRTADEKKKRKKAAKSTQRSETNAQNTPYDEDLYESLRIRRTELAAEDGVPPYVIASNALLEEICRRIPMSEDDMLAIHGMGPVLFQKYGAKLLETVQEWAAEHGNQKQKRQNAALFVMPQRTSAPRSDAVKADTEAADDAGVEKSARPATPSMPRNGEPWSEAEDLQLVREVEQKLMLLRIASAHGRSATEIFRRMRELKLQ